jgi:glycosyltransferase involved in cell wall biosynthesis
MIHGMKQWLPGATLVTSPTISVIVTSHDEGAELARTLNSVRQNTRHLREIVVVDDGSHDGSCDKIADDCVRVLRHDQRIGVARSRDDGSRAATGDVLCYLDAHQRVAPGCLDRCAQTALERQAITCPDLRGYEWIGWRRHGADFELCPRQGYFSARWRQWFARRGVTRVTGLRAPPYLIPRALYPAVAWSRSLRGWGASEASIVLKSFFLGIDILQLTGPVARHRFQRRGAYETTWEDVWRNQAIIARVCFDEATWFGHWLPRVFAPHLTPAAQAIVESAAVQSERLDFAKRKVRADAQFWTELLAQPPPALSSS